MKEWNKQMERGVIYIYTPFCGTCSVARAMLDNIERLHQQDIFHEINASIHPEYMQNNQIESVPCLLFMENGEIVERIYTFYSTANIYDYLIKYQPELFSNAT
ncbi:MULTISPECIES: thioredoxin family protein [Oceanobacillus]|uniref:Thioredoxin domain-containing protein n=1 Tax=Oceanobacillus kimchii TaxID=746691 RepID=A0ABQ5TLL0_9BACI|nr:MULTISPECIES: thioredoxin family protein [Oceanobacillus]MBT2601164.1 thioredoxin family protein [Oceanobacillus sp. ISL-74]MBT2652390.1 thioredoxin family protein [Oceanobacillus sp. ISL-73]MCT1579050.1 thioredoxin family protein [Oceanobacillus kimchii]MCT2137422.1 thioredoxin family protein [Oceanobacillus kimchii]OEH53034.1 thioredoxin [Oceanobacillus sp. E9]